MKKHNKYISARAVLLDLAMLVAVLWFLAIAGRTVADMHSAAVKFGQVLTGQ